MDQLISKFGEGFSSEPFSYLCQNQIVVFANSIIGLYDLLYGGNRRVEESQIEVGVIYVDHIIQMPGKHKEDLVQIKISSNLKRGSEDVVTAE